MTELSEYATAKKVLALPLEQPNDAGVEAVVVRDYLVLLLGEVWNHGECFNGKSPFGNSCWESDLYIPLVKSGMITGEIDEDGYLVDYDGVMGNRLINLAIQSLY